MKAVVHIGVSKAGSTTIQETTFAHRAALLKCGVLVPTQDGRFIRPIDLANAVTGKSSTSRSEEVRSVIEDGISRHRPQALLLSSEYLYYKRGAAEALEAFLAPWADDVDIVLYVRDPVKRYLSLCQQSLKGQYKFIGPAFWNGKYRTSVERWRKQYGDRLTVLPFQRSAFPEGLVSNLFARFFPETAGKLPNLDDRIANQSDPTEATRLLEAYFKVFYPNAIRKSRRDVDLLRSHLAETALEMGLGERPTLRPEAREVIARNHSEDLAWLAAEEGIVFDGVDAEATSEVPYSRPQLDRVSWSEVVSVDPQNVQRLGLYAARSATIKLATWPARKLCALWRRLLSTAP